MQEADSFSKAAKAKKTQKKQEQTQHGTKLTVTSEQARGELFFDDEDGQLPIVAVGSCQPCYLHLRSPYFSPLIFYNDNKENLLR